MEKKIARMLVELVKKKPANGASGDCALGNTSPKRIHQSKYWCFTFNNYTEIQYNFIHEDCKKRGLYYIIGKEIGELEQTPHLQGFICSNKKFRWTELKWPKQIHWEKCKGSPQENIDYCAKGLNYVCCSNFNPVTCIVNLKDWQLDVINIINSQPDGRSVYWYYDEIGGKGKSALCKYLWVRHSIPTIHGGKLSDIINFIFNIPIMPSTILIDIPRNNGNKVSYSAIECILNGMIFNTKFETGVKVFNPPHVIVFSNSLPDEWKLSEDRWKITSL